MVINSNSTKFKSLIYKRHSPLHANTSSMDMSNTRSTMFAFKCMIGTSLTRLDINATSRTNIVKQLFISKQGETHFVCLRFRQAISRTQFSRMLEMVESNMRTLPGGAGMRNHLRRPHGVAEWKDTIFMGDELREGEGDVIRQTLKRHMEQVNPQYSESHSTTTRHVTHMLRDSIRPNPSSPAPSRVAVQQHQAPSVASSSGESAVTLQIDESPPQIGEMQPVNNQHSPVFMPALVIDGHQNMVEPNMDMATMVSDIVRTVLNIGPDFNMQQRFDNIDTRINNLTEIARLTREELGRD